MLVRIWSRWWRGKKSAAQQTLRSRHSYRPSAELLEDRTLLSFAAPLVYNTGTQATLGLNGFGPQVATADFNGDGKLDVAVSNTADNTISILLGNGNGTFAPAVNYGSGASGPVWLSVADLNADGKLDLAVEGNNQVGVLLGNGDGSFKTAVAYAAGPGVRGGIAAGDFFGNGRLDLAMAANNNSSGEITILPNNGDGTFGSLIAMPMPAAVGWIRSIATGDLGNGHADLVVAAGMGTNNQLSASDPANAAAFMDDGHGTFTYAGSFPAVTTPDPGGGDGTGDTVNPEHVNVADLNNDGKLDLVLSLYDHNIDVFLGNGDGTFQTAAAYTTETPGAVGGYPRGVVFADVNADGKPDIITDNFGEPRPADQPTPEPGSIGVLYGNGDGTFQAPVQYTPYQLPGGVAVGDFNGDGWPDLTVSQNYTGHSVAIMLNQPNTATLAPTVTAISPGTGPTTGGSAISITGTGFAGTTQVLFGSVSATSFVVNSDTSITATAPPEGAGVVDITVYNAGSSAINSTDQFTFTVPLVPPTVTAIIPSSGSTNGGTLVSITGTNFSGATAVRFGGVNATSFTVNSATSITATTPAEAAGTVDITVTTPGGTSNASAADRFSYVGSNASDTWTGLGLTNNWSDTANWSANLSPGAGSTVIFNSTSTRNAVVDPGFTGTIAALQVNSGYTGTVTLNENLTVAGAFSLQAGTFDANGYTTSVTGSLTVSGGTYLASTGTQTLTGGLTVSGGTFAGASGTVTTTKVTLSAGTLSAPSSNLIVTGGNFTYTGGSFNANGGTVTYTGVNTTPTLSVGTGLVGFYNFTDTMSPSGSGYPSLTITGTLTVTGTFTWQNSSNVINGNIEAQGNVDDQNHGGTGNPCITLDGAANQLIEDTSGGIGGCIRTLTINKTGGTVTLACNPLVFSAFSFIAGNVNTGTFTWRLGGQGPVSASNGLNMGNIEIDGNVTVSSASLQVANVTFTSGKSLTAPTGNLYVSGNWNNAVGAAFTPNGGTVVFNGASGTQKLTSGGKAFKNLTNLTGGILELEDNLIILGVFVNSGAFNPNGHTVTGG